MFTKILVANRGEIALRVICACKELQILTVAVYSEVDRHSLHVRFADEAVCIGPAKSYESYLNIPSLISAAEITNVDAIHPGYGYLAESAYFAEVCESCGIKFIGPSPASIQLMGDKVCARKSLAEAGLPVIPGTDILNEGADLEVAAAQTGYPLIIKAAAGGGGRGMRVVKDPRKLRNAFETAQSEAENAFGTPAVYMEHFLENPRHIEFQVLADHNGNTVHLGERECSIQRRHQKLIEESPSPGITAELRDEIGAKVVKAMRDLQYQNAGTVEFLFDQEGNYYFIEMNTRIQVEHPVTEMVTGFDVLKEQIRIAAGETLSLSQQDIVIRGHSMECRLNAESPNDFAPSPGKVTAFHPPGGPGIRVDSAAYHDFVVSTHYDSLIAKLIAHGRDRQETLARLNRALDMFVIEGVETSIPLHKKIINHSDFINGEFGTSFLNKLLPQPKQ